MIYLGAVISSMSRSSQELRRRKSILAKEAVTKLTTIRKKPSNNLIHQTESGQKPNTVNISIRSQMLDTQGIWQKEN